MRIPANKWTISLMLFGFGIWVYQQVYDWRSWQGQVKTRPQPTIAEVKAAMKSLDLSGRIEVLGSADRSGRVSVWGQLRGYPSLPDLLGDFDRAVKKTGWEVFKERKQGSISIMYCRRGIAAIVGHHDRLPRNEAVISVYWTMHTAASEYCPVPMRQKDK